MERFTAGNVLGSTFLVLGRNFGTFCALVTVALSPVVLYYTYHALALGQPMDEQTRDLSDFVLLMGTLLLTPLATAAVTYGVVQDLRGRPASFAACLSRGISRMLPVLGIAAVTGLLVLGGLVLLVVPGLIALTALYVATPAAVVESGRVSAALRRSARLTEGSRLSILGLVLVLLMVQGLPQALLDTTLLRGPAENAELRASLHLFGVLLFQIVATALWATSGAVAYYELRRVREGTDIEQLAAVFD